MEYHITIKREEILTCKKTWVELEALVSGGMSQTEQSQYSSHLYAESKKAELVETEQISDCQGEMGRCQSK